MSDTQQVDEAPSMLGSLGFVRRLEFDGDAGRALLEFECRPEFCHTGGIAQGGFVTGWIDAAMAHATMARHGHDHWIATLEIKISFFRPATPGLVRAEGWLERSGRQTLFAEGRLLDLDGQVLAKGSSTIRLVPQSSA